MVERLRRLRAGAGTLAAALLPGCILGLYVRHPAAAFLPYLVLVPWVVLYTGRRAAERSSWPYFVGAWFTWVLLYPGCYGYGWFAPPLLGALYVWPWLPFAPVLRRVHLRFGLPRALSVPVVWVAVEWLRSELSIANFDLYRLGATQARFTSLVQIADLTGEYGVSFLVAAAAGLLADLLLAAGGRSARERDPGRWRRLALSAAAVGAAFAAAELYGIIRLRGLPADPGPRIAVVQPNVRHTVRNLRGVHLTAVVITEEQVPAGAADLVVWPENAIMDDITREGPYREDLRWLASRKESWFLVGALGFTADPPAHTTNSAFLLDPEGEIRGRYDKVVLFPWSEYVPLDGVLSRLWPGLRRSYRELVRDAWGFLPSGIPGAGMRVLELPWKGEVVRFAVLICGETAYAPVISEAARMGARFVVNITSEGEVGGPVQEQLLRIGMIRAVENRVACVRSGNTGISAFIDPAGRVRSVLVGERGGTINDAGVLVDRVELGPGKPTPYARSRDAFAKACAAATAILLAWTFLTRRRAARAAAILVLLAGIARCAFGPGGASDLAGAAGALERGQELLEEGRPAEALPFLRRACGAPDPCRRALGPAARAFAAVERPERGAEFFASMAATYPELAAEAHGYGGSMLERALEVREAEREYRASLALRPTAWVHGLLGNLLLRVDKPAEAAEQYREGSRADPGREDLRAMLGYALLRVGDLEEARATLEGVVAEDPGQGAAWIHLASVHLAAGDLERAREALGRALEADPVNLQARFHLARLALRAGDLEATHRLLREIQEIEAGLGRGPREGP